MASLFGNYDRPGPGVRKDAPPQKAVPRFFSIFQRKFFDLIKLNLLFLVPVIIIAALIVLLRIIFPITVIDLIPLIFLSPFVAGLTFVTRNYAREEHAFIFSDFKDAIKENWKAFLLNGFLFYLFITAMIVSITYYRNLATHNILGTVAAVLCIVMTFVVISSQYYVPVMIVTFDLKLRHIFKNSLIFAVVGLGRNLLLTILLAILVFLYYLSTVMLLTIIISIFFTIFLLFTYCSFLINFTVYPLIDKMMIKPYLKQKEENGEASDNATSDFTDRS